MTAQDPLRIAIRSGIGARALELGFKRKSERLYVREDDAYREWVYFGKTRRTDWGFSDFAGIVAKDLEATIASSGVKMSQYNFTFGQHGHVYFSALDAWGEASRQRWDAVKQRFRWIGPLVWFLPLETVWRLTDDFERSRHIRRNTWDPVRDPEGCAAASLAKWSEVVEPWFEKMRDPVAFADWYLRPYWGGVSGLARAAVFARAGMRNKARACLQWEYDRRNRTFEQSLGMVTKINETAQFKKSVTELTEWAVDSREEDVGASVRALAFGRHIGVEIVEKDD